ncbi:MAG: LPS export ABC transporter ATP-binding protein [Spirochaetales bacterium]|nr:LPS export ABC transporter ATP-binding protein [Spirochaetales bacterium]
MNDHSTISVEGLVKQFRKKLAVDDVSFSMHVGEVVGLLGPNGAGKTTIFYMIVGFIKPTIGSIYLNHHNITNSPMYKRAQKGISYLPQEPSVFRKLTVEQNIWAILETRNDLTKNQKKEKLEELLTELGIEKVRKQKAYTLSGGERRRTEIARSLAIQPKFLLLDEPFAGIDPIAVHEIKKIVQKLSSMNIGVLITDHNVRDTLEITQRSYIINHGKIKVSGTKEQLLSDKDAREIYLGENFQM